VATEGDSRHGLTVVRPGRSCWQKVSCSNSAAGKRPIYLAITGTTGSSPGADNPTVPASPCCCGGFELGVALRPGQTACPL
jgi:hypothetical protein